MLASGTEGYQRAVKRAVSIQAYLSQFSNFTYKSWHKSYEVGKSEICGHRSIDWHTVGLMRALSGYARTQPWWLIQTHFRGVEFCISACHLIKLFLQLSEKYLHFFHSEHTSLPDYKGSGGQCWTDCIFSLHRQWTQKGQFPPLASGEIQFYLFFILSSTYNLYQGQDQRVESALEVGPLEIIVFYWTDPIVWVCNLLILESAALCTVMSPGIRGLQAYVLFK